MRHKVALQAPVKSPRTSRANQRTSSTKTEPSEGSLTRLETDDHQVPANSTPGKRKKAQIATTALAPLQGSAAVIQKQPLVDSLSHVGRPAAPDPVAVMQGLRRATGVKTDETWNLLMQELIRLHHSPEAASEKHTNGLFLQSVAFMAELEPVSALEAVLCVQMIGVHRTAMRFITRATAPGQTDEGADLNVLRATRLMRLFTEQTEALLRLRGKSGQQKVTVEHVTVNQGGRAIVGAVSAAEPEAPGGRNTDDHK